MGVVKIKWTDPPDILTNEPVPCTWAGTVVVRKEGSAPKHRWDGTEIEDSTTRDEYSVNALVDSTITQGHSYYYGIFPYDTKGDYRFTKTAKVSIGEEPITPVGYIQSDKTLEQYIDTGIYGNAWYSIEAKFKVVEGVYYDPANTVIGCQNQEFKGLYVITVGANPAAVYYYHTRGWGWSISGGYSRISAEDWHKYYIDGETGYLYVDDLVQDSSSSADNIEVYPKSFYIFANNFNGAQSFASIQLAYLKIWDKDRNLVRDFIPILDSNNKACLFDNVTNQKFYNQGQGDFSYGNLT